MPIVLYSYFRSSAAYRVRIALNLKNIDYRIRPVHLLKHGGEQFAPDYLALNPQGRVPVLIINDRVLTQSSAIIEYLEEVYLEPPLLPTDPLDRAYVRSLAQLISCDIHPLNNLRVLNYLKENHRMEDKSGWYRHWVREGFAALEKQMEKNGRKGRFCFGDTPGMADTFLVPQVYNGLRFDCGIDDFPLLSDIYWNCMQEPAFIEAAPENQSDAEL